MMEILSFLFFLNLIIFVHELGHFLMAKKFKLPVLEFSLGFPPKIFSKKIKKTVCSFGILLLGGYVKLKGEENPEEEGFYTLPVGKRIIITLGGVLMNFFLAYFLFSLSFLIAFPRPTQQIIISGFLLDSPFKEIFSIGDIIRSLKIDNKEFYFKNPQEFSSFLKNNLGKDIVLKIERRGELKEVNLRLPEKTLSSGGVLGVYLSNFVFEKKPFPLNFVYGLKETVSQFLNIISNFYFFLKSLFGDEKIAGEIVGPVGIFSYYQYIINFGLGYVFYFIGVLSLYLVFFNILPFPALDGGRIIFFIYEGLTKRRLNVKIESLIHQIGFYFLFFLLLLITFKDILKLKQR